MPPINLSKERKRLENINEQLEEIKEKAIERKTEKNMLLKQIKEDFDCSSIEELEELQEQLEEEKEKKDEIISKKIIQLESELKEEGLMR